MDDYKFYISRLTDGSWEQEKSLEDDFEGLRYKKCTGLSKFGKPKNIYIENYAETDELRVFIPENVVRENTEIELELCFSGNNRRNVYDNFVNYITGHRIKFWDTCRKREVEMILVEAIEPSEDILTGSIPYIVASFKFTNCNGQTKQHS